MTEKSSRQIVDEILKSVREEAVGLDATKTLKEQGFDSLDMYSVLLGIEERFHVKVRDEDAVKLSTIQNILDYVAAKQA